MLRTNESSRPPPRSPIPLQALDKKSEDPDLLCQLRCSHASEPIAEGSRLTGQVQLQSVKLAAAISTCEVVLRATTRSKVGQKTQPRPTVLSLNSPLYPSLFFLVVFRSDMLSLTMTATLKHAKPRRTPHSFLFQPITCEYSAISREKIQPS